MSNFRLPMSPLASPRNGSDLVRDMGGQVTKVDADKIEFKDFFRVINYNVKEGNLESRDGNSSLTTIVDSSDNEVPVYGIGIYEQSTGNNLVVAKESDTDGTKADIVIINRTNGNETDLETEVDSQSSYEFTSQNSVLYASNGETDLQMLDPIGGNTTLAMPTGGEYATLIESDGTRVWAATTLGVTRFSNVANTGKITTFTQSGTDLQRAGVVNSKIVDTKCLASSGTYIAIAGTNQVDICATPNLENEGVVTFPDDYPTVKRTFQGIGTNSKQGMVGTPYGFFIKPPSDEYLYLLRVDIPTPKKYYINSGRLRQIDFSNAKLVHDERNDYIYIYGTEKLTNNPVVTVFDLEQEKFWEYSNMHVALWAGDKDNMYFLTSYASKIIDALVPNSFTDEGVNIDTYVESSSSYGSSLDFFKYAKRLFTNFEAEGNATLAVSLNDFKSSYANNGESVYSKTYTLENNQSPFADAPQYFGLGISGNVGFDFESKAITEYYNIDELINEEFFRASLSISANINTKIKIRGMGLLFEPTTRPINATQF